MSFAKHAQGAVKLLKKEHLMPSEFFNTKAEATPKASMRILVPCTFFVTIVTLSIGFGIFVVEITTPKVTKVSTVSPKVIEGQECEALSSWTNQADNFQDFKAYRSRVGMFLLFDIALTKKQCSRVTSGACEAWADAYVGIGENTTCCMSTAAPQSNCYTGFPPAPPSPWYFGLPLSSPSPPYNKAKDVSYCGGSEYAPLAKSSKEWLQASGRRVGQELMLGTNFVHGSGMQQAFVLINETVARTIDVPNIHVPSRDFEIYSDWGSLKSFEGDAGSRIWDHQQLYWGLSQSPRPMLALTTCALGKGPGDFNIAYSCAGTGMDFDMKPTISTDSLGNYLTTKLRERYPFLRGVESQPALPQGKYEWEFRLNRSDFVNDCEASIEEICGNVETHCMPYICYEDVKTYPTLQEAFGISFANYGIAASVLTPVCAVIAVLIERKMKRDASPKWFTSSAPHRPAQPPTPAV